MKLLFVSADRGIPLDGSKGASVHVRQTVNGLARCGFDLTLAVARPGRRFVAPGPVISIARDECDASGTVRGELSAIAAARDLARAAAGEVRPDLVYERYSLWSLAGAALADEWGVPLVVEVNAPLVEEQLRYRRLALVGIASEIERTLLRRAQAVLCVSTALALRARELRGSEHGVHVVPNGVDTALFHPAPREAASCGSPRVVFVGSLKPWHGLPILLTAFAGLLERHPASRLCLVGEGPERARLERLSRVLGIARAVEFTGAVEHERVPALLAEADLAVAAYPPMDGFYFSPLKVGEYLAAGVPLVASRSGDLAELLADGETALVVPPGDVGALTGALLRLAGDAELGRRLARAGRRLAVERLSLDATFDRLRTLFGSLVQPATVRVMEVR